MNTMKIRPVFLVTLLTLFSQILSAGSINIDGIAYRIADGSAYVTANGDNYAGFVEIPETINVSGAAVPVVGIDEAAFADCDRLYTVDIPETLTTIGKAAFAGCDSLISILVPDGVEVIPECCFADCSRLEVLIVGSGVKRIETGAFAGMCSKLMVSARLWLSGETLPEADETTANELLLRPAFPTFLYINSKVTDEQVGKSVWAKYADFGNIDFSISVLNIGVSDQPHSFDKDRTFTPSPNLVRIDGTVKDHFSNNKADYYLDDEYWTVSNKHWVNMSEWIFPLKYIQPFYIGYNVEGYDGYEGDLYDHSPFRVALPTDDNSFAMKISSPIGTYGFYSKKTRGKSDMIFVRGKMKKIVKDMLSPKDISYVPNPSTEYLNTEFKNTKIPNIENIRFGATITVPLGEPFFLCGPQHFLENYFTATTTNREVLNSWFKNSWFNGEKIPVGAFVGTAEGETEIIFYDYVKEVGRIKVIVDNEYSKPKTVVRDKVTYRTEGATARVVNDKKKVLSAVVQIPDTIMINQKIYNVTEIAESAFSDHDEIYSVFLPDSLETIGKSAFSHCDNLISIVIPGKVEQIPDYAFSWCSRLRQIFLGKSVKKIGYKAFEGVGSNYVGFPHIGFAGKQLPEVGEETIDYLCDRAPFHFRFSYQFNFPEWPLIPEDSPWKKTTEYGNIPLGINRSTGYIYTSLFDSDIDTWAKKQTFIDEWKHLEAGQMVEDNWWEVCQEQWQADLDNFAEADAPEVAPKLTVNMLDDYQQPYLNRTNFRPVYFATSALTPNTLVNFDGANLYAQNVDATTDFIIVAGKNYKVIHDIQLHANAAFDAERPIGDMILHHQSPRADLPRIIGDDFETLEIPYDLPIIITYPFGEASSRILVTSNHRDVLKCDNWSADSLDSKVYGFAIMGMKPGQAQIFFYNPLRPGTFRTLNIVVSETSAVTSVAATRLSVTAAQGSILVTGVDRCAVELNDLQGRLISSRKAVASARFEGLSSGVYIVRAGDQTRKVIVR